MNANKKNIAGRNAICPKVNRLDPLASKAANRTKVLDELLVNCMYVQ